MGKLRVLWEGNKEPVTNLGITADASAAGPSSSSGAGQTLFVLTTSQILALSLDKASKSKLSAGESSSASSSQPALLDELGAAVGCAKVLRLGLGKGVGEFEGETAERMVVARDEAIYVYGKEGREGCWAYEGPKSYIVPLHSASVASPSASSSATSSHLLPTPYLAIVSPPQSSSLSSNSATIRAHAARSSPALGPASSSNGGDEHVAKVTVFDPENKFIAFSGTYSGDESGGAGVRSVVEAWGAVWVLTDAGKLFRLTEQPLETSFSTLFQRNLYTLAISLAHSRGLGGDVIAENYRRYGDHLYGKADYEGAMAAYLKTVGTVQASYVIRKFLDAQRLTHLTSYLQELHSRGLANTDITTLLLNCYTKLADDEALSRFIHSSSSSSTASSSSSSPSHSSDEPPFDLDTAIRVLRQAGYFAHATWLAQRYRAHGAYLRIAIEDSGDCAGALRYVRELARDEGGSGGEGASAARDEARESLARWGGVLLQREPELTTEVLVEVCCGVEKAPAPAREGEGKQGSKDSVSKDRVGALKHGRAASGLPTRGGSAPAKAFDVPDSASVGGASSLDGAPGPFAPTAEPESTSSSSLPSPRSFFAHFVDRPRHFISFLEQVVARRYGKPVDSLVAPSSLTGVDAPLPAPRTLDVDVPRDAAARDEQVVWSTLLELYISAAAAAAGAADERERARLQGMALRLLRCQDQVPYDETQALLVCTTQGFEEGFVLLYELLGMYEDIVRYWIDAATSSPSAPDHTSRIVRAVRRYGPSCPSLYALVLRHLTTSSDILSRHQADLLDLLDEIDRDKVMPPIKVVQLLSANGNASVGLVREYLKRQLLAEKQEFDSDQALIKSYRTETLKKRREIAELSDPTTPRIFQVTRCSACGGQLDLPGVHFMCRHSYHQRCLGENESQCPNCARTHGVVREIRRNNEQLRGGHDVFLDEVRGADDPFAAVAGAFARGWMGERGGGEP
ncbi:uncharacterized protein RHOBADRAFT_48072 [Rhodotorula graminis WP1]|uniref:E3 ubiquitin-protein ligase PEP5 n=1 Tax=Rhodotorula graminis (strain WP1) TaxID=578459 RepID=A0A194S8E8_RHOGW|nr:uncharacterized protein RHOBADRAFT_48072 [Rhodotorula graminis WP1]KPV76750.1 hypothetical protein RHOBADRAFT_48072 [Rhodotorula graminis WP1]